MKYASVRDGIGAVHVAWQPLGWKCAWTAEIDAFPAAVVEQRWGFPNRGDTRATTVVAQPLAVRTAQTSANGHGIAEGVSHTLDQVQGQAVMTRMAVRRLTPRECERLQGFPDDYTAIEYRKKPAADGPRYKALGNSMAVPVMRWIGERIGAVG